MDLSDFLEKLQRPDYNNGAFLMPVEDVMPITGRRVAVKGKLERGTININEQVEIVGMGSTKKVICTNIKITPNPNSKFKGPDTLEISLDDVDPNDIKRGQVLAKPGTIKAYKKFKANIYKLRPEEGGEPTPLQHRINMEFQLRTTDITGIVILPVGTEIVMPGDNIQVGVELVLPIAFEVGQRFAIREGGRNIAIGAVTTLLE